MVVSLCSAQDRSNPFNIVRKSDLKKETISNDKKVLNPFVIKHTSDTNSTSSVVLDPGIVIENSSNPFNITRDNSKSFVKKPGSSSSSKKLKPQKDKRAPINTKFIFWVIIFIIFLFAILINYKRPFILKSYRGILNENYLKLIKREENNGYSLFFMSLYFIFLLSISVFIYLLLFKYKNINIGLSGYIYLFLTLVGVYLIRWLVMKFLGYIFEIKQLTSKYFFFIIYYNILFGICLVAINVIFAFGNDVIATYSYYLGLIIFLSLLLIRYVRGLILSIQYKFLFKVQFILYLCAVEIAPVFISLKILSNFGQ